jgi:hypothetical protein
LSFFRPDGALEDVEPQPSVLRSSEQDTGKNLFLVPLAVYPDGGMIVEAELAAGVALPQWAGGLSSGDRAIVVASSTGVVIRVIASFAGDACIETRSFGKGKMLVPMPFCAAPMAAVGPVGHSATIAPVDSGFVLMTFDPLGRRVASRTVNVRSPKVTARARDSLTTLMQARLRVPDIVAVFKSLPVPERLPVFHRMVVSSVGEVWVEVDGEEAGRVIVGFDARLRPLGVVRMQGPGSLRAAHNGVLWVAEEDQDGAPVVARYAFRRASR